jgi:Sap, sulfolipid-1-addressing protein
VPFELLFLALASAFWPLLLAVAVAAMASDRPVVVLGFFILGGLLTCIVEGVVIVALLRRGHAISASDSSLDPVVYYAGAMVSFVAAAIVQRLPASGRKPRRKRASRSTDAASRLRGAGPVTAFSAGVVVNVIPGIFPLVALKDIAELDVSLAGAAAIITGFYLVMFLIVEVPFVAFLFAPTRTAELVDASMAWASANKRRVGVVVLVVVGCYLFLRGILTTG